MTHRDSRTLELWLANAPAEVLTELEELHPGTYAIHNDAPRPESALHEMRDSFDWAAWKAEEIEVVAVGPRQDGYLRVGVVEDPEDAQKKLDAGYGPNVVRVSRQSRVYAC